MYVGERRSYEESVPTPNPYARSAPHLSLFEFDKSILLKAKLSIQVGIYLGFVKVHSFLIVEIIQWRDCPVRVCINFDARTGLLVLNNEDWLYNTFKKERDNEEVECICEDGIILSFRGVREVTEVNTDTLDQDTGDHHAYKFTLRGYQGLVDLNGRGSMVLDWGSYRTGVLAGNLIETWQNFIMAGSFDLDLTDR